MHAGEKKIENHEAKWKDASVYAIDKCSYNLHFLMPTVGLWEVMTKTSHHYQVEFTKLEHYLKEVHPNMDPIVSHT